MVAPNALRRAGVVKSLLIPAGLGVPVIGPALAPITVPAIPVLSFELIVLLMIVCCFFGARAQGKGAASLSGCLSPGES